ncbi:cation:proton antiporter [Sphingomicrobium astaxanthinifaciens]|uniref:cation:proton antiporter n=1 Tax=Sphingomicrobium astaxanthinifaciens TaxID=1227949 RepID=UPI001FCA4A6F|nr:sodium:proton antiporter [Sphingomicrobium astaxanthinifaciens]MCJ7420534.1 cation:proton antiporter [Sphingomicrobium astaxanthinifaciens]
MIDALAPFLLAAGDNHVVISIALIGLAGMGAQWVAWRTGLPAIALMLVAGILLGPVTGLVRPNEDFGELLEPAVALAVAIILFEGGLQLRFNELKKTGGAVPRLVLIGVPVGWALGALALHEVAGLTLAVSVLFAGILVVTGPTVIIPLLRQTNLAQRPRAILKWEGIVNDPLGALAAVVTYEFLLQQQQGTSFIDNIIGLVIASLAAGAVGWGAAKAVAFSFPRGMVPEYLKAPILFVTVIGTFVLSNLVQQETGLLAVTVMGIALANMHLSSARTYLPFKENITIILVSGVFVTLSASLDWSMIEQFQWRWAAFLLVLLFLVRPATVLISLAFSKVPWKERLFVAWIAPRGIVLVAISGLFALRLDELGYSGGMLLITLSFAVVAATIVAHGFTAAPLARLLGLNGPDSNGVLIVGTTPFSLQLAKTLRELKVPVMIADTSWQRLGAARAEKLPTFHGEILAEATEEDLDFNQFQVLVATTGNEAYNALVCSEFAPEIGSDNVYQLGDASGDDPHALPTSLRGRSLFDTGHGVEDVADHVARGWKLMPIELTLTLDTNLMRSHLPEEHLPLFVLREDGRLRFYTHASRPDGRPGDTIVAYVPPGTRHPLDEVLPDREEERREEAATEAGAAAARPDALPDPGDEEEESKR